MAARILSLIFLLSMSAHVIQMASVSEKLKKMIQELAEEDAPTQLKEDSFETEGKEGENVKITKSGKTKDVNEVEKSKCTDVCDDCINPAGCGEVVCHDHEEYDKRVMNGKPTLPNELPYQVRIQTRRRSFRNASKWEHTCGASILNARYVLTAAHCITAYYNKRSDIRLLIGDRSKLCKEKYEKEYEIESLVNHPTFMDWYAKNGNIGYNGHEYVDVALMRTAKRIEMNPGVQPICILSKIPTDQDATLVASGWGNIGTRPPRNPAVLQHVELKLAKTCGEGPSKKFGVSDICTTFKSGKIRGVCGGDSGGPLAYFTRNGNKCQAQQVGIASHVGNLDKTCNRRLRKGQFWEHFAFASVPATFDWIKAAIKEDSKYFPK